MEEEGEDGMLHSLLTQLPELSDGHDGQVNEDLNSTKIIPDLHVRSNGVAEKVSDQLPQIEAEMVDPDLPQPAPEEPNQQLTESTTAVEASPGDDRQGEESENLQQSESHLLEQSVTSQPSHNLESPSQPPFDRSGESSTPSQPPRSSSPTPSHASTSSYFSRHVSPKRTMVSLPDLLTQADTLYAQYPPALPELHIRDILGPQSVIHTWSEDPDELPSDDEAEKMATHTSLIVLPFVDPDDVANESDDDSAEKMSRSASKKKRRARHRGWRRKFPALHLDKKTFFTGAVVTLAVAVAVYSCSSRSSRAHDALCRSLSKSERLTKAARVASRFVTGGAERVMEGLKSGARR